MRLVDVFATFKRPDTKRRQSVQSLFDQCEKEFRELHDDNKDRGILSIPFNRIFVLSKKDVADKYGREEKLKL